MKMNQSKFAQTVGCSQQNISKLIKKGTLFLGSDKKLDYDESLQRLREFDLLDENNKLKKTRTAKKEDSANSNTNLSVLPLDEEVEVPYSTIADMTPEEREEMEKAEIESFKELEEKKKEAKKKNISFTDDLNEYNYSNAKAHREHYMGQIAELDYLIKIGEYVPKEEVEKTFFEASRTVRDMLLNAPSKLAARVLGKKDIKEVETIIMDEIQYILGNLSK